MSQWLWSATMTLRPDRSSCEYKIHFESGETEILMSPLKSGNSSVNSRIDRVRPFFHPSLTLRVNLSGSPAAGNMGIRRALLQTWLSYQADTEAIFVCAPKTDAGLSYALTRKK
jgi:hypothetical protein